MESDFGKNMTGKKFCVIVLSVLTLTTLVFIATGSSSSTNSSGIKNVILMITDGTSATVPTLSRWYKAYDSKKQTFNTSTRLALDEFASGLVRTYWKDPTGEIGAISDSAAAASTYSIGRKSNNKYIGLSYDGKKCATVLELAKSIGKSTGLVATVNVQHATPAAFAAHTNNRNDYEDIASQMVANNVDVVLGGGLMYMLPEHRKDKRNLVSELKSKGYAVVDTKKDMQSSKSSKLWGLFADDYMTYELDRASLTPEQPSLSEMTDKALNVLSKDKEGFFLMVEGSKVDWSAHNNEPIGIITEFLEFDNAVKIATDFAKKNQDTMVLIMADHGNSGITIGDRGIDKGYGSILLKDIMSPLKKAQYTSEGIRFLLNQKKCSVSEALKLYGISNPTAEELAVVKAFKLPITDQTIEFSIAVGKMISTRSHIGFTTGGHTGEDVILYSYLPKNKRITGVIENSDVAKLVERAFGASLDKLTEKLFAEENAAA